MKWKETPWTHFDREADFEDLLAERGWEPFGAVKQIEGKPAQDYTRPGKDTGTSGTLFLETNKFYVFTTNAEPLESGHTYSASEFVTWLDHYDTLTTDPEAAKKEAFRKSAAEIAAKGFGTLADKGGGGQGRGKFRLRPASETMTPPTAPEYLIDGFIGRESLCEVFGESEAMKSFLCLGAGLSLAAGIPWHGRKAFGPMPVVYVAGEGHDGLGKRMMAWHVAHNITREIPFFTSSSAAHFLDAEFVRDVWEAIDEVAKEHGSPGLVVVDTLARSFVGGDENSAKDVGRFVDEMAALMARYRCSIVIVHHTGQSNKERARGSASLRQSLDFEYRMEAKNGLRVLHCEKNKEHAHTPDMVFKVRQVDTGWKEPETGFPITSCVLELTDGVHEGVWDEPLKEASSIALEALARLYAESGKPCTTKAWREECRARGISTKDTADAVRMAHKRACDELAQRGIVQEVGGGWVPVNVETNSEQ